MAVYGPRSMVYVRVPKHALTAASSHRPAGECSRSCGSGRQAQVRQVDVEPAHGGQICPEDYDRYVPCNEDPCPIDCGYSQWVPWATCDASCGPGSTRNPLQFDTIGLPSDDRRQVDKESLPARS